MLIRQKRWMESCERLTRPGRTSCLWRPIARGAGTADILPIPIGSAGRSPGNLDPSVTSSCPIALGSGFRGGVQTRVPTRSVAWTGSWTQLWDVERPRDFDSLSVDDAVFSSAQTARRPRSLVWGRGLFLRAVSVAQWLPDSSSWCLCAASSSSGETGATRSSKKRRDNRPRTFSPPLILPFLSG